MIRVWKAFRFDKNGRLRFLFHTYKGSSLVPIGRWLETKSVWVRDGKSRKYRSGFHFFLDVDDAEKFITLTKGKYVMIEVDVDIMREKPNSSTKSWLAKRLHVPCCPVVLLKR